MNLIIIIMLLKNVLTIVGGIALFASCVNQPSATVSTDDSAYDQRKADSLGIPKGNKLSACDETCHGMAAA